MKASLQSSIDRHAGKVLLCNILICMCCLVCLQYQKLLLKSNKAIQKSQFVLLYTVYLLYKTYLLSRRCLPINLIPKLMIQFGYQRLFEGTETVSSRLSLQMAWMEMD